MILGLRCCVHTDQRSPNSQRSLTRLFVPLVPNQCLDTTFSGGRVQIQSIVIAFSVFEGAGVCVLETRRN